MPRGMQALCFADIVSLAGDVLQCVAGIDDERRVIGDELIVDVAMVRGY